MCKTVCKYLIFDYIPPTNVRDDKVNTCALDISANKREARNKTSHRRPRADSRFTGKFHHYRYRRVYLS